MVNDSVKSNLLLLPYILHPVDNRTVQAVKTYLANIERRSDLYQNAPIIDLVTGLTVPTCAVTISPKTGNLHPVGMYINILLIKRVNLFVVLHCTCLALCA